MGALSKKRGRTEEGVVFSCDSIAERFFDNGARQSSAEKGDSAGKGGLSKCGKGVRGEVDHVTATRGRAVSCVKKRIEKGISLKPQHKG